VTTKRGWVTFWITYFREQIAPPGRPGVRRDQCTARWVGEHLDLITPQLYVRVRDVRRISVERREDAIARVQLVIARLGDNSLVDGNVAFTVTTLIVSLPGVEGVEELLTLERAICWKDVEIAEVFATHHV